MFVHFGYCASPLCPFDLLSSPKMEENECGANYPTAAYPYPAALSASRKHSLCIDPLPLPPAPAPLQDFESIPWPAVSYILGIIVYGGRVTDFLDLRCVQSMLNKYLEPGSLEEGCQFTSDGTYYPPNPGPLSDIFEYLGTLPAHESPEVCLFLVHCNFWSQ